MASAVGSAMSETLLTSEKRSESEKSGVRSVTRCAVCCNKGLTMRMRGVIPDVRPLNFVSTLTSLKRESEVTRART